MAEFEAINGKVSLLHEHLILVDKRVTKQEDCSSEASKKQNEKIEKIEGQIARMQRYQDEDHAIIKDLSRQLKDIVTVVSTLQTRVAELGPATSSKRKLEAKKNASLSLKSSKSNGNSSNKKQKDEVERVAQLELRRIGHAGVQRIAQLGAQRAAELKAQRVAELEAQRATHLGIQRINQLRAERAAELQTKTATEGSGSGSFSKEAQQSAATSATAAGKAENLSDRNGHNASSTAKGEEPGSIVAGDNGIVEVGEKRKSPPSPAQPGSSMSGMSATVVTENGQRGDSRGHQNEGGGDEEPGAGGGSKRQAIALATPEDDVGVAGASMDSISTPQCMKEKKLSRRAWGANFIDSLFARMDADADRDVTKLDTHEAMLYEVTKDNPRLYRRKIQALFAHPAFREAVGFSQYKKDGKDVDAEGVRSMISKLVEDVRAEKEMRFKYGGDHYDCYFYR